MKRERSLNTYAVVFLIIMVKSLTFVSPVSAQVVQPFRPHEIIEAGNNLKIEILKCRGEGENEECDVIYYTIKRQNGKRKWEKTSRINELRNENRQPDNALKPVPGNTDKKTVVKYDSVITSAKPEVSPVKIAKQQIAIAPADTFNQKTLVNSQPTTAKNTLPKPEKREALTSNPAVPVYTLEQCYKIALDSNISVRRAANNIRTNAIDRKTAQYGMLPSISYNLGHYFSFGKNIDPVTNTFVNEKFSGGYTALGLQLELFAGFKRLNTIRQSGYIIKASEYAKKQTELELLTNVSLTYARLILDREQLQVQRNNLYNLSREIEVINERIKVGRLSKYEFYTFNARFNTEQADLVTLQNDSSAALQGLKRLLNISYNNNVNIAAIDTSVLAGIFATPISIDDISNTVLKNHPAIKQAQMNEQAARLGEKIAKSNFLPSLSAGGNLVSNYNGGEHDITGAKIPIDRQLNNNLGQNININLRIPIFSQLENINRVKKERINIANAQLATRDAVNTIVTNTLQLVNDFNTAKAKYKATLAAFEQNSLSYDLYSEKYKLGQISSVELLTAREIFNTSTSKYLQAKLQMYFQFRLLDLLQRY